MNTQKEQYQDIIIEGNYKNAWKYYLSFYKSEPIRTFIICFISLIASGITIAIPFLTQYINKSVANKELSIFITLAFTIISIYVIKIILDFLNEFLGNHFNYKIEIEWRTKLVSKIYKMRMIEFENRPLGDFVSRIINDLKDLLSFSFQFLNSIIYVFVVLLGGFIYIFTVSWIVAMIPLFFILVSTFIYCFLLKKCIWLRHKIKGLNTRLIWKIEENIQLISEIKSYTITNLMLENYSYLQKRYLKANKKSNFQLAIYKIIGISTNVLTTSIIFIIASYYQLKGSISYSQLIGLTSASSLLVLPLTNFSGIFIDVIKITPSLSRLFFWINCNEEVNNGTIKKTIDGKIEFKNVNFQYKLENNIEVEVLKDFNLLIQPKEFVSITGFSGSGKTTILKLLQRFYDVDEGQILIDDIPIKEFDITYLRNKIAYISTRAKLFTDVFVDKEFHEKNERFNKILKDLGIYNLFLHKKKIDENLNSQGILLSEGEKQMLSFARAMYFDSSIIIMDNVDNCLDKNQISKINNFINNLENKRTIIVATSTDNHNFNVQREINISRINNHQDN